MSNVIFHWVPIVSVKDKIKILTDESFYKKFHDRDRKITNKT